VKNLFEFVVYVMTVLFILIAVVFCILICGKLIKDINDLSKKPTVKELSFSEQETTGKSTSDFVAGEFKIDVLCGASEGLKPKPCKDGSNNSDNHTQGVPEKKKPIKKVKNLCNDPDYICLEPLPYATVSTETPIVSSSTMSTGALRINFTPEPDPCQAFYDGAMLTGEHPFDADGILDRALNAQLYLVCREHFKSQGLN
jgi:hypothetical protein